MASKDMAIIAKGLSKSFGDIKAVDSVSLDVKAGEFFGLLGPNGSGKTTMIRLMTGQLKPDSGTAIVGGVDVRDAMKVLGLVGIIPEQETPPSFLTAEEYLHFVGKIRKLDGIGRKAEWWLDFLEFGDQKDMLCKDLSRGTRQKLMFAQAFIHGPGIAFIDEPLINLDPVMQRKIEDYLKAYAKKGNTVFFSTHVLEIAEKLCSRVGIIYKGRLIHEGSMKEIMRKNKHLDDFFLKLVKSGER